jgi:hypothetical protein
MQPGEGQNNDGTKRSRGGTKRNVMVAVVGVLMVTGIFGFYLGSATFGAAPAPSSSGTNVVSATSLHLSIAITKPQQRSADIVWMAKMALKGQFWSASCYVFCGSGVTYTMDPTVITGQGHDIEQCLVFGASTPDTCTAANFPKIIGLSVSTTAPAVTDSYAGTGPCSTGNIILTNGLIDLAGTVTPGAFTGTSSTTTIANTFTASGTVASVQAACLLSALTTGTNPLLYAEGTFGPDSLAVGNTLTITWSITRT